MNFKLLIQVYRVDQANFLSNQNQNKTISKKLEDTEYDIVTVNQFNDAETTINSRDITRNRFLVSEEMCMKW